MADIKTRDGILYFDIEETDDDGNRHVKTSASRRKIPIHSGLVEHGFLDYVSSIRSRRETDLFPELKPAPPAHKYGEKLHYTYSTAMKKQFDGNPRKLGLHSLRHYVKQELDGHISVSGKARRDILGHEGKDVHDAVYGTASPLEDLQRAIELLPFPLARRDNRC